MKKVLYIIIPVVLLIVIGIILINKHKESCVPFSGGSFKIVFVTNSDDNIGDMRVCIACSPDSYDKLPEPTKEGYKFEGWYYDKSFTKKVSGSSSLDVEPIQDKDVFGCMKGYKDIYLYAKWE